MLVRLASLAVLLAAPALLTGCAEAERVARQSTAPTGGTAAGIITMASAGWHLNADEYVGRVGQRYAYDCVPNPSREHHYVWGAGPYTSDSSVCAAGVHAGAITFARGGRVVIEMRPGQTRYVGTERNGVAALDYDQWEGSFAVVL